MKTFLIISVALFAAGLIGWLMLFSVPEPIEASDPPLTTADYVVYWIGGALALPTFPLFELLGTGWNSILVSCFVSALFWSSVICSARLLWRRAHIEPNAAPNGGPARRLGNSGVAEGPPSVS